MGGASSASAVEEMLTATYMLGRALTAVAFPGMYRIYDFHSPKAPKLQTTRRLTVFANDDDSEDDEDKDSSGGGVAPDPSLYDGMFRVHVGGDVIFLEDPLEVNDAGWTPLHTCCMSSLTVAAGIALIDETVRLRGALDTRTIKGPGNFNSGWTPLHMAAAYGIEPLVVHLLKAGADPNTSDDQGNSPLLEACHRGFAPIATALVASRARLDYLPPLVDSTNSPFSRPVPQTALGESARSGFNPIVQMLVDAGAPKNQSNCLGWTPLHEACFYNRIEVVKILMLNGANAALRTDSGALPYHFAGLQIIRNMLRDMGGEDVVPEDDDLVDMAKIMRELTVVGAKESSNSVSNNPRRPVKPVHGQGQGQEASAASLSSPKKSSSQASATPTTAPAKASPSLHGRVSRDLDVEAEESLLHSGPMLGDLPSLASKRGSPGKPFDASDASSPRKPRKKKNRKREGDAPRDAPPEYLCELSHRLMSDPMRSSYGNTFERTTVMNWIREQGQICPMTGLPLADNDLKPDDALKVEIQQWILSRSQVPSSSVVFPDNTDVASEEQPRRVQESNNKNAASKVKTEDLYDF